MSKDVFVERLERRYGEVSAFNEAWGLELDSFEELKKGIYKAGFALRTGGSGSAGIF